MMLRVASWITSVLIAGGASSSLRQPSSQPSSSNTLVCFSKRPTALETAPLPRRTSGRMVVFRTIVIFGTVYPNKRTKQVQSGGVRCRHAVRGYALSRSGRADSKLWKATKYAIGGSFERANTLGPLVGGIIIWAVMRGLGMSMALPDDVGGTLIL